MCVLSEPRRSQPCRVLWSRGRRTQHPGGCAWCRHGPASSCGEGVGGEGSNLNLKDLNMRVRPWGSVTLSRGRCCKQRQGHTVQVRIQSHPSRMHITTFQFKPATPAWQPHSPNQPPPSLTLRGCPLSRCPTAPRSSCPQAGAGRWGGTPTAAAGGGPCEGPSSPVAGSGGWLVGWLVRQSTECRKV